ncbi:MAG: hypothetical protein GKR88_02440 [Flavobacteriaceae bacterium]|nr:MAG: hypothetical protein GKR88_02010 [Flavobacteriaceae bacterium]QMU63245.1 MAG: hypothetical protein GKR88_02440 [Flavobacteriaceae bacterium]
MKKIIVTFTGIALNIATHAQIGVRTMSPASAAMDISSTSKGFLLPRMTKTQIDAIASPAEGLIVYCTNCNAKGLYLNNGSEFINLINGANISAHSVASIVAASDNPANGNPSIADLTSVGLTNLIATNLSGYEVAIDAPTPAPTTLAELQTIINNINASDAVLAQIGSDADSATQNSTVTIAQLNQIIPALTAINDANETAYRNYIDANPNSFSSPATQAEVQAMIFLVNTPTVVGAGGAIFMDRNLGATQVATSSDDSNAYGDLYQWGRNTDGHQFRTSSITAGPVASGNEGSVFILNGSYPYDWLSTRDDTRWNGATKGSHDPCPDGFRVPTEAEWQTEFAAWTTNNAAGAFNSPLKLTTAGDRHHWHPGIGVENLHYGFYWSSTASFNSGATASLLQFNSSSVVINSNYRRSYGMSVRCIYDPN